MSDDLDLEIVLKAKGVEVATSRDAGIWLTTMGLISGVAPAPGISKVRENPPEEETPEKPGSDLVERFAQELGVQRIVLEGAAGPSSEAPYIHLDHRYWAALKNTTGTKSVAPVVLAATLLLLWDRHAKIGDVTLRMCGDVLRTIDLTTKNATRAFKNCDWIQLRGSTYKLNPALIGTAEELARKYCSVRGG